MDRGGSAIIVVADASAIGSILLPDEGGPNAALFRKIIGSRSVHVPPHWAAEVSNILWKAHRQGRIDGADLGRIGAAATAIAGTTVVARAAPIDRLAAFATATQLTAYDAAYLMLAVELAAPLLVLDGKLSRAARAHDVEVLR